VKLETEPPETWRGVGLAELIRRCARVKAVVVSEDPREAGLRRTLNLGHTTAHALESLDPDLSHGRAVALGLLVATRVSTGLGRTETGLEERIRAALRHLGLPVTHPLPPAEAFLARVRLDKKRQKDRLRLVIPVRPGQVDILDDVPEEALVAALAAIVGGPP